MMNPDVSPPYGPGLAPTLGSLTEPPRVALERLAEMGFRHVQLSATQPGLRPRDLDRSARRDLRGKLNRLQIGVGGLDLWIPPGHFSQPQHADRAVGATLAAIRLAADLGHCPLSLGLPQEDCAAAVVGIDAITEHALRFGVPVVDHAVPPATRPCIGVGIDPPAWIGQGRDPVDAVSRWAQQLGSARLCDLSTAGSRMPVGEAQGAQLDVKAYRSQLAVSGYVRPLVVDMRQWPDPWGGLEQTARTWARLQERPDAERSPGQ